DSFRRFRQQYLASDRMILRQHRTDQGHQQDGEDDDANDSGNDDNGYFHGLPLISPAARASKARPFTAAFRSLRVSLVISARTRSTFRTEVAAMASAPRAVSLSSRCLLSFAAGLL